MPRSCVFDGLCAHLQVRKLSTLIWNKVRNSCSNRVLFTSKVFKLIKLLAYLFPVLICQQLSAFALQHLMLQRIKRIPASLCCCLSWRHSGCIFCFELYKQLQSFPSLVFCQRTFLPCINNTFVQTHLTQSRNLSSIVLSCFISSSISFLVIVSAI